MAKIAFFSICNDSADDRPSWVAPLRYMHRSVVRRQNGSPALFRVLLSPLSLFLISSKHFDCRQRLPSVPLVYGTGSEIRFILLLPVVHPTLSADRSPPDLSMGFVSVPIPPDT